MDYVNFADRCSCEKVSSKTSIDLFDLYKKLVNLEQELKEIRKLITRYLSYFEGDGR